MFKGVRSAYTAGFRAGAVPRPTRLLEDGTRVLVRPKNPHHGITAILRRLAWANGFYDGSADSLRRWVITCRKGAL